MVQWQTVTVTMFKENTKNKMNTTCINGEQSGTIIQTCTFINSKSQGW